MIFSRASIFLLVAGLYISINSKSEELTSFSFRDMQEIISVFMSEESELSADFLKQMAASEFVQSDKEMLYKVYNRLGSHYYYLSELDKSTQYFKRCKQIALELGNDELLADSYVYIGVNYDVAGHKQIGLENYLQAARIYKQADIEIGYGLAQHNIGVIYQTQKQFDKALESYHESLAIERKFENNNGIIYSLYTIAVLHYLTAQPDSMLIYLEEYEKLLELFRDGFIKDHMYFLRGNYYSLTDNHQDAEILYKKTLAIFEERKYSSPLVSVLAELGHSQTELGKLNQAEQNLNRAERMADSLGLKYTQLRIFDNMHKLYLNKKEFDKASYYSIKYANLIKEIYQEENTALLSEYQIIWETEKRESQIALLRKDIEIQRLKLLRSNYLSAVIAFVLLFTSIIIVILSRQSKYRKKINHLLQDKNHELAVSNATKDKFFKIIAHDLKNPLSAFRNISGMIDENINVLQKEELSEYLKELRKSSESLNDLLNNLLQWAISQTDNIKAEITPVVLKDVTDKNLSQLQAIAKLKGVTLINRIDANLEVETDQNIFITITRNIISNAIKFSFADGEVVIYSEQKEACIEIKIRDEGIGIEEEDIFRLFKIEENTKDIGNSPEKGTGLGLILCRELAEKINAELSVVSKKGEGSTFILSIPQRSFIH